MKRQKRLFLAAVVCVPFCAPSVQAVTTVFFNSSQTTNFVSSGTTSDTTRSEGYLFTYTRDKLFTGGVGLTNPVGRYVRVFWPAGLEAQAVTTGPALSSATFTIKRQDGQPFGIPSFTAKLLGNTAATGAAFEIMPKLNGEDGVPNPFTYDASGYYGMNFTYNTPELSGFDTYIMTLFVDYALMSLTVVDASLPPPTPPTLQILMASSHSVQVYWPTNDTGYALQQNSSLGTTNWVGVTNAVSIAGTNYRANLAITNGSRCFRLIHP